jgi:hypothetical protein
MVHAHSQRLFSVAIGGGLCRVLVVGVAFSFTLACCAWVGGVLLGPYAYFWGNFRPKKLVDLSRHLTK